MASTGVGLQRPVAGNHERMSQAATILVFLLSAVLIAAGSHTCIKRYFLASFVAACATAAGIQLAGYIELGHVDPFWPIVSVTGFLMAGIIALITGLPFRIWRTLQDEDD
jgi:hypothetical protein